jgi:hypothetical protein
VTYLFNSIEQEERLSTEFFEGKQKAGKQSTVKLRRYEQNVQVDQEDRLIRALIRFDICCLFPLIDIKSIVMELLLPFRPGIETLDGASG